jgi:hypothetical protein
MKLRFLGFPCSYLSHSGLFMTTTLFLKGLQWRPTLSTYLSNRCAWILIIVILTMCCMRCCQWSQIFVYMFHLLLLIWPEIKTVKPMIEEFRATCVRVNIYQSYFHSRSQDNPHCWTCTNNIARVHKHPPGGASCPCQTACDTRGTASMLPTATPCSLVV